MTQPRTIKEVAQIAIKTNDVRLFGRVVDQLRDMGFNYNDCVTFFVKNTGIDSDTFEMLSYESDSIEQ